jgi:hypothetical protein
MAQILKSIHATGRRTLAPDKAQKALSVFDTRATTPRDRQLTKRASRNQQPADLIVKAARETGDSVAAIHAAHFRGPQKSHW